MKTKYFAIIVLLSISLISKINLAQNYSLRNLEYYNSSINYNFYGATRFNMNVASSPLDRWSSNKTKFILDELPINISVLGFNTFDLLPIDKINSKIDNNTYENKICISQNNYSENLEIKLRGFLGAETGDPLIFVFTEPELELPNKNKIIPSGAFQITNSINDFSYSFTGGYYGFFSTGSENDKIINRKSHYYFMKHNKQFLANSKVRYKFAKNKSLELSGSFMSYYGWDISPFTTSYIHFENYFSRLNLRYNNLVSGLTVGVKRDEINFIFNPTSFREESSAAEQEYMFYAVYQKRISKKDSFGVSFNISNVSTNNKKNNDYIFDKFYLEEINKTNLFTSLNYRRELNKNLYANLKLDYNHHFINKTLSGYFDISYEASESRKVKFIYSNFSNYPNLTELYGRYNYVADEMISAGIGSTSGNQDLLIERREKFGVNYSMQLENGAILQISPIFERVKNPIEQLIISSYVGPSVGEFANNSVYSNGDTKNAFSFYSNLQYNLFDDFSISAEYKFVDNSQIKYTPKHKSKLEFNFYESLLGSFKLNWIYQSATTWNEFRVRNVYETSSEYLEEIKSLSTINIYYTLLLRDFYFTQQLELSLALENILDEKIKFLPIGNTINRSIIFSAQFLF